MDHTAVARLIEERARIALRINAGDLA